MKTRLTALFFALFASLGAYSQAILLSTDLQVREVSGDDPSYRETGSLDGFVPYAGGPIPRDPATANRKVVFVRELGIAPPANGERLCILVGPSDYPCDFYLNGKLLGYIGAHQEFYNSTVYQATRFAVDTATLTGEDTLVIEAFPAYETTALPVIKLGPWNELAREAYWRNLLNVNLIQAAVVFALILAAFFVLLYLLGSKELRYVWFVLICATFAMSYTNMSLYNVGMDVMLFDKITRCGMPLTCLFFVLFALEFSGFRIANRRLRYGAAALLAVPTVLSCAVTILSQGKEAVFTSFSTYTTGILLPVLLLTTLALLVYGLVKRPGPATIGVLLGFGCLIAASVHDISYSMAGNIPFVWTVPYGYIGFVLSIFFVLALDQTAVLTKTRAQAKVMADQHDALSTVVNNLTQVSQGLVSSSDILANTMNGTLALVENYGRENKAILGEFAAQAKSIEEQIAKVTERLTTTASRVPEAISNQTRAAKGVTGSLQQLGEKISDSLGSVEQTNGFIATLAANADNSRRVVANSRAALARVEETSGRVKSILGSIAELGERTNVLSINAAIESARYGSAGKGFAVIAQEIRKFANQSQDNIKESFDGVQEMSDAIVETIKNHDAVQQALEEIINKSHMAAEQSDAITRLVHEQESESKSMAQSADRMIHETNTLESLSQDERAMNEDLKKTLSDIARNFERISRRLESQGDMKDTLFNAIDQMRSIMQVNADNIEKLKASTERAKEANSLG